MIEWCRNQVAHAGRGMTINVVRTWILGDQL